MLSTAGRMIATNRRRILQSGNLGDALSPWALLRSTQLRYEKYTKLRGSGVVSLILRGHTPISGNCFSPPWLHTHASRSRAAFLRHTASPEVQYKYAHGVRASESDGGRSGIGRGKFNDTTNEARTFYAAGAYTRLRIRITAPAPRARARARRARGPGAGLLLPVVSCAVRSVRREIHHVLLDCSKRRHRTSRRGFSSQVPRFRLGLGRAL